MMSQDSHDANQYFDESPNVKSKPVTFSKNICGFDFEFKSDSGVFSRGTLDKASEILIKEFDENYSQVPTNVVDVGCGYGPLICFVGKKFEHASLVGVEPNLRARELCAYNYQKNLGDSRLSIISPEEINVDTTFDLIISNPPIRVGKKALYELLKFWSTKLSDNGQMWLVMSKHLGADSCAKFLESDCNMVVTRIASKKGFRVLKCSR
jgi:16S rRNA (guanine1207-N2)-methyltransferase